MVKRSLKFLDPTNLRLDTINLTLISFTGGEETKFVIVELQRIEFNDNLRYNVSIEYIYISIYSETDEIRFPVVWEALKNNMSKLRAMRIKRRESGYWGLISVRFSRTGRVKPFSNERKEKEKITHSVYEFNIGTNDESRVEIARLDLVIDPFSNVIKIDECLYRVD